MVGSCGGKQCKFCVLAPLQPRYSLAKEFFFPMQGAKNVPRISSRVRETLHRLCTGKFGESVFLFDWA